MEKVIIHDQILNRSDAKIDLNDRGYHFGDGVYEVIRILNSALFTEDEHLERFFNSAKKIKMNVPYSKEKVKKLVRSLVYLNDINTGIVYFQLTRGNATRTHKFPTDNIQPVFTAFTLSAGIPELVQRNGVEVITTEDVRWLRCEIKSLNLLPNVLAKQEAVEKNCFEAIFHRNGIVTEASSTNVFIVKDGTIITHPATRLILNGITRQVVIHLCEKNGFEYTEAEFSVHDLTTADEVFITSSTSDIIPVVKVDKSAIGKGVPGLITQKLQSLFREKVDRDTKLNQ